MMQSVQVIIERLKTNPEDFFGGMEGRLIGRHAPKFNVIREKLDDLLFELYCKKAEQQEIRLEIFTNRKLDVYV
jgi:hypothetical protein